MITNMPNFLVAAALLGATVSAGPALSEEPEFFTELTFSSPKYTSHLIFDGGSAESEALMDDFQGLLTSLDGQTVWLDLTLVQAYGDTVLNSFDVRMYPRGAASGKDEDEEIGCGNPGVLPNLDQEYVVSFNRPADNHGPTTIHIGDRRDYPLQSIKCLISAPGHDKTLRLRGHFVVEATLVHTAFEYVLFPIDMR